MTGVLPDMTVGAWLRTGVWTGLSIDVQDRLDGERRARLTLGGTAQSSLSVFGGGAWIAWLELPPGIGIEE